MKNILATQIKSAASPDENRQLYERLVAGEVLARDEMIERNMGLVIEKVNTFVATRHNVRYLQDDLVSNGTIGLVKAVDAMAEDTECYRDPVACMCGSIMHAMSDLFETESPINVSRRVRKRATSQPVPGRVSFNPAKIKATGADTLRMFALRDQIDACCLSDWDREIVRLREEGYTVREIARAMRIKPAMCSVLLCEIARRYEEIEKKTETRGGSAAP